MHRGELQFLGDVSKTLAGTLEVEELLDSLLGLTVPRLADAVSFFLLEEGHYLRRAASIHVDPAKTKLMRELRGARIDIDADPDGPLARVVRTQEPFALPRLDRALLDALALDEFQFRTLESLGMRAWHALPLVAHGEATGVLSLATVGDRAFSERDLDLAREFAARAPSSTSTPATAALIPQPPPEGSRAGFRFGSCTGALAVCRSVTSACNSPRVAAVVAEATRWRCSSPDS